VLKAGKFYVALILRFPWKRNSYMLEDSQTALIVTNSRNVELARTSTTNSRALL
jgi:non-ribosomal peptide synthetase component F